MLIVIGILNYMSTIRNFAYHRVLYWGNDEYIRFSSAYTDKKYNFEPISLEYQTVYVDMQF